MGNAHHPMTKWLHGLISAFQFLSRIPVPIEIPYDEQVFKRSVPFYPLVGGVIGLLLYAISYVSEALLPALPASLLILIGWIALTGGLHLDGLMDTADGILSHRSRERMLEIMKDSRVGAMGVIVCVLYLLMKFSLIYMLVTEYRTGLLISLMIIPIWSRWFITVAITSWPYARISAGMGSMFKGTPIRYVIYGAAVGTLLSIVVYEVLLMKGFADQWRLLLYVVGGMLLTGLAAGVYIAHKLGGQTGDTYGALNEFVELAGLMIVVSYYHLMM